MTIDDIKQEISIKTGVPAELIKGESVEEITASAAALATFKREYNSTDEARKAYDKAPTREKFAAWISGNIPAEPTPEPDPVPAGPNVPDGGEPYLNIEPTPGDPRDAFSEWFKSATAFNPHKDGGLI